jgi:uncharacterized protein YegL
MKSYIALVLDKSGSMSSVRESTVRGFNEQVQVIRKSAEKEGVETYVSLVTFNENVSEVFMNESSDKLAELTTKTYSPDGGTALYDAVKHTVNRLQELCGINETDSLVDQYNAMDTSFLVIILTDGEENSSRETTAEQLSGLIKELEGTGHWTFTVMGANINLKDLAEKMGLDKGNVAQWAATAAGTAAAFSTMGEATAMYMSDRSRGVMRTASYYSRLSQDPISIDTETQDTEEEQ